VVLLTFGSREYKFSAGDCLNYYVSVLVSACSYLGSFRLDLSQR